MYWVPAATNPPWSGMAIYLRYRQRNTDTVTVSDWSSRHTLYHCPDRDLLLTNDANWYNATRPLNEHWDEVIVLAPYTGSYADFGSKYAMNNYTAYDKDKWGVTNHRQRKAWKRDGQVWISDSGGSQIGRTKVRYLDPKPIPDWYADNSDVGIALDIPIYPFYSELLEEANQVQRKNTEFMLKHKPERLEIMTALHGANYHQFIRSAEMLLDDRVTKLSFSGFSRISIVDALLSFLTIHKLHGDHHDHYHILGVSGIDKLLVFARWSAIHGKKHVLTADSSRHLQEALRWGYYTRVGITERLHKVLIGSTSHVGIGTSPTLPCGCAVCQAIKYLDVFGATQRASIVPYLILYHNQFLIQEMMDKIRDYAEKMDEQQYQEFGMSLIRQSSKMHFNAALRLVYDSDKPMKRLVKKYQYFGGHTLRFGKQGEELLDEEAPPETEDERKKRRKYLRNIIKGYLKDKFSPEDHGRPAPK